MQWAAAASGGGGGGVAGVKGVVYSEAKKARRCTKRKLTLFSGVTGNERCFQQRDRRGPGGFAEIKQRCSAANKWQA